MAFAPEQLNRWVSIAEEATRLAGAYLAQSKDSGRQIRIDSRRDVKIEADKQSERIILEYLREKTEFTILSEESGSLNTTGGARMLTWIVDPLDGSLNYSRGIPLCCVSVGLWQGNDPLLGSVYDFNNQELFSGIVGEGAWLNGQPLRTSTTKAKEQAVLCTGFPINTNFSPAALSAFVRQVREYKKIRLLGSAALSLACVAAGRADAYLERDIMLWDVAGGLAIVLGAGGEAFFEPADREYSLHVYASTHYLSFAGHAQ